MNNITYAYVHKIMTTAAVIILCCTIAKWRENDFDVERP